ncbi:MAG: DUF4157 domain-containing protein [Microcystaceae cyanobacterium]
MPHLKSNFDFTEMLTSNERSPLIQAEHYINREPEEQQEELEQEPEEQQEEQEIEEAPSALQKYDNDNARHFPEAVLQKKMTIGEPNDKYEQEADRIAEQVMRMSEADLTGNSEVSNKVEQRVGRKCRQCEEEEKRPTQKDGGGGKTVIPSVQSGINQLRQGGGTALPSSIQRFMEPRFGQDFADVKVHTSPPAANLSQTLQARAFTVGQDIFFNRGEFQPSTSSGKELLAHELVHTLQQNPSTIQRKGGDFVCSEAVFDFAQLIVSGAFSGSEFADALAAEDFTIRQLRDLKTQVRDLQTTSDPLIEAALEEIDNVISGRTDLDKVAFVPSPCEVGQSVSVNTEAWTGNQRLRSIAEGTEPPLKKGERGEGVKLVQQALLLWGCEYAAESVNLLPRYGDDGDFGREMQLGVKEFQKRNGLSVDGIVGFETLFNLQGVILINESSLLDQRREAFQQKLEKLKEINKKFSTIPSDYIKLMEANVNTIKEILLEYYISDSDEKRILAFFRRVDTFDQNRNQEIQKYIDDGTIRSWPPGVSQTMALDRFMTMCFYKNFWKGTLATAGIAQNTNVFEDLYRELEDDNLSQFKSYVQKSKRASDLAKHGIAEFPNFWEEVVVKSAIAIPAGITSAAAGGLQSLPSDLAADAGNALKEIATDYQEATGGNLEIVNYIAAVGEVIGLVAQATSSGGVSVTLRVAKIIEEIESLAKAEELLDFKDKFANFLDLDQHIKEIKLLLAEPEKILWFMFGLDGNSKVTQSIITLENWLNQMGSNVGKSPIFRGKLSIVNKMKKVIKKIHKLIKPIFKIRRKISTLMNMIEASIGQLPMIERLLALSQNPEQISTQAFQGLLTSVSQQLAQTIKNALDTIRQSFSGVIETISEQDLSNGKIISDAITNFALNRLSEKSSIIDILKDHPDVKSAISENLVQPIFPEAALNEINQTIRELAQLIEPATTTIQEGLDVITTGVDKDKSIEEVIQSHIQSQLKGFFIQTSSNSTDKPSPFSETYFQNIIQKSSGENLDHPLRSRMENAFGSDFSKVKIHRDTYAQEANQLINANAFTLGEDVFFNEGKFAPQSPSGQKLLAHELTHVVQQSQGIQRDVIQRDENNFKKLQDLVVEKIGQQALKGIRFRKADSQKEKMAAEMRERMAELRLKGRPIKSKSNPKLPEGYLYVEKKGKIVGIRRHPEWKKYLPQYTVKRTQGGNLTIELSVLAKAFQALTGDDITELVKQGKQSKPAGDLWRTTPNWSRWVNQKGGKIRKHSGGSYTLIDEMGNAVKYNKDGDPDFRPYLNDPWGIKKVVLQGGFTQPANRDSDFRKSNKQASQIHDDAKQWSDRSPPGYTWHHTRDGKTMQLVPRNIHRTFTHRGGVADIREDS